jgi:hypothetical protein
MVSSLVLSADRQGSGVKLMRDSNLLRVMEVVVMGSVMDWEVNETFKLLKHATYRTNWQAVNTQTEVKCL